MAILKQLDTVGTLITDEIVRCNESVTINSITYYKGYLNNTCDGNIQGNTSTTYTIYDAAGKTGNRKMALTSGYPSDSTAITIDTKNGYVYSKTNQTVYVTYLAHEPINYHIAPLTIDIPYCLTAGSSITIATINMPYFCKYGFASINVYANTPSQNATIILSNGTETQTLTLTNGTASFDVEFSTFLKVTASEVLTISTTNGYGAYGLSIQLLDI